MSELRQDPTTMEWVILAPERGKRPTQRPKKRIADDFPGWDASCPFCPGNEVQTPDEVFKIPIANEGQWEVRVVPNRFAALTLEGSSTPIEETRFFRKRPGFGVHEVIIESPSHNTFMAQMNYEQVEKVLITYQERYNSLKKNPHLMFITIFKNHGWASGTSLIHPHSQLVATPVVATYYRRKFNVAAGYRHDTGRCLYCDLIAEELKKGDRVVAETDQFVVINPYASRVPYETWILPKMHCASFGLFPAVHLADLARVLKDTLFCLYQGLDNPAFNFAIDTTTTFDEHAPYYHWHIRILPRLTTIAGFEIGSGIYISPALPEESTIYLRQVAKSCPGDVCIAFKDIP